MSKHLTLIEVPATHVDHIKRYGGEDGIRDPGLLESPLFRPKTGYNKDLMEEAAPLWESLSQYHPFVDGNKRTGLAVVTSSSD